MRPLIGFTAKYFILAFALAGALYLTWHWGRAYEKRHDQDVTFAECQPTSDPQTLDCVLYEVEPNVAEIWKAIINELNNPTTKEELKKDYEAFTERKAEL
ncbi:MAG: hypothetical protein ACREN0_07360 [Thermodesulfobacteriota bacterium]